MNELTPLEIVLVYAESVARLMYLRDYPLATLDEYPCFYTWDYVMNRTVPAELPRVMCWN